MKFHRLYTVLVLCAILFSAAVPMGLAAAAQDTPAALDVIVTPDTGPAAETVGYTITVTNTSGSLAQDVVVEEGLELAGAWDVDHAGCSIRPDGLLSCGLGNLAAGESVDIHVTGNMQELVCDLSATTVTASADNAVEAQADVDMLLGTCPINVGVLKTAANSQVLAGEPISFTITAFGSGGGKSLDVVMRDVLPTAPGLSWTITAQDPVACQIVSGELVCNYSYISSGGDRTVTVTSPTTPESCGLIRNTATVTSSNELEEQNGDNQASAQVNVICDPTGEVDVNVSKVAVEDTVDLDGLVQFSLEVTNTGSAPAQNVTLTDTLPVKPGLAWSIDAPVPAGCAITEGVLTCNFGTLNVGETRSVNISSIAGEGSCGQVSNTALVTATGEPEENLVDNTANAAVNINCPSGVNVAILKTTEKPVVYQGDPLVFTMVVTSAGQETAEDVILKDPLPTVPGLKWTLAQPVTGCAIAANILTCEFGSMASGESRTVKIGSVTFDTAGLILNTATVSATNETPGNQGDNESSAQVQIPIAACLNLNLFGGKYTNNLEEAFPGQIGVVDFKNNTAPKGQKFMGQYGNETVSLTVGCLPPHEKLLISYDLYILRSWDGNSPVTGPDRWQMALQGLQTPLIDTTFSNWTWSKQAYPGWFGRDEYDFLTGSLSANTLGYYFETFEKDTIYHITMIVPHSGELATFNFTGIGLQALIDESWGLDNITVVPMGPHMLYHPEVYK